MSDDGEPRNLGAFPYRRNRVACSWCPRRLGDYSTERMIARLGAGASLNTVLRHIAVTCRWPKPWGVRAPNKYVPWCRAFYTDLGRGLPPDRGTRS